VERAVVKKKMGTLVGQFRREAEKMGNKHTDDVKGIDIYDDVYAASLIYA